MFRNWLSVRSAVSRKSPSRRLPARRRPALLLENLEDRTVPTVFNWTGGTSADWFTAANWTDAGNPANHAVPGAADTAVILGGPNATVLSANATVGNLQVSGGFLTLNASLTDNGNYSQDSGYVAFGADTNLLTVDGNFSHPGGVFFVAHGTVVLAGAGAQTVTDISGHTLPNLHITNTSAAGVTVTSGSSLTVTGATGLTLDAGASLTLAGTATLTVNGNFTDNGKLFLNVPAPGNATAPVTVSGTLTASNTAVFDLTVGSPANGNVYRFVQYGTLVDNGAAYVVHGNGSFSATIDKTSPFIAVKLSSPPSGDVYDWNGSVSSDWFTAANWTDVTHPGNIAVPGATDTAVILGGPNATVLNSNATVGKLQVSGGFLTLNASLTDTGSYSQDSGYVAFGADSDLLTVDGNFSHPGGVFIVSQGGTVVLAGTSGQTVTDTSGHTLPNLHITNTSAAGVTVASGSSLTVTGATGLTLDAGASLTLAGTATLTVFGNFTDNGKLFLNVPAPGNTSAPLRLSGTLALSATSAFDLTMGGASAGNVYLFITYGAVTGAGLVPPGNFTYHPNTFTATPSFGANQFTVALSA